MPSYWLRERRRYRELCEWVDDAEAVIREVWPSYPPCPRPIPKSPDVQRIIVQNILAIVRSFEAAADGADGWAVFREHAPVSEGDLA